jgi:hypothetical protein
MDFGIANGYKPSFLTIEKTIEPELVYHFE